jgi:DNA-binding CsgD family transcriptional regulator
MVAPDAERSARMSLATELWTRLDVDRNAAPLRGSVRSAERTGRSQHLLGREREWARIERSLAALPGGGVVIALEGSPGVGKTTLWQQAIGQARRLRFGVRATSPGEPDAGLAFAGLGDLLDCLPEQILEGLPEPQRRAVSLALVVDGDTGVAPDQRALLRGALGTLRSVAATTPLLIAIDDEQWLDSPTARVLGFALPRLRDAPIGVVMTRRPATDGALWAVLAGDGGGDRVLRQTIEPLDLAAVDALLANRLGHRLPRSLVRRIHAGSGGNPLYALAIAQELQNRPDRGGDLPIPRTLADAISRRLDGVGERAHEPLLAVAASSRATLALIDAVTEGFTLSDLDAAVAAEVIEIAGDQVRFTHPLLASTHYATTSASQRRAMHRRLGEVIADPQQRARHLALGAEAPSGLIASAIEQGAAVAAGRGAPEIAAELLEEAARLTPADAAEVRLARLIHAAELHETGGCAPRSRDLLQAVIPELGSGPLRARALISLAGSAEDYDAADALMVNALADVQDHPDLQTQILLQRSAIASNRGEFTAMSAYAEAALVAAQRAGAQGLLARALASAAIARFFSGQRVDQDALRRAVELEDPDGSPCRESPSGCCALIQFWSDDYASGVPALERVINRGREHGEQYEVGALLFELGLLEWFAGNVEVAERHHAASRDAIGDQDLVTGDLWLSCGQAMFATRRGDLQNARQSANEAVGLAHEANDVLLESFPLMVLAAIELRTGSPEQAHERLSHLREGFIAKGFGFLGALTLDMWATDIEALIALDRLDDAQRVADDLATRAEIVGNPNAAAVGERCQGLLLAARGDFASALARMQAALDAHRQRLLRPELARTLLERGTIQRRAKQKNAAKQSLDQALAIFEEIGASIWAARARDELRRVGLKRKSQEGLTPAQARVVELVCAGMSNRQIAGTLYMSPRSVESHLTKAYREFGVKSRAQLVAAIAGQASRPESDV